MRVAFKCVHFMYLMNWYLEVGDPHLNFYSAVLLKHGRDRLTSKIFY